MKLATINNGRPDGQLVIVSRDLQWMVQPDGVANTLQEVLENWADIEGELRGLASALTTLNCRNRLPFNAEACLAPLPRADCSDLGSPIPTTGK